MSNTVPEGWERKLLKDTVSTVIAGQSPNRKDHAAKAGKYGILKTTAIDWGKYSPDKNQEVLDDFKVNPKHEVKTGDILITKAGPVHRVGVVTYVPETPEKMLVSGKMTLLRTGSLHDSLFLSYALATEYSQKPLKESTTGMALSQTNFTHETLLDVPLWVPQALPEQQKIAAILSSVDDVIEKTRAQIDKLKDLKTGMMQELLTKGIGSGGVPHTEFKDSPVGRIPASWDVKALGELTSLIKSGLSRRISSQDIGIPLLISGNIKHGSLDTTELRYWYVDDPQGANTSNYMLNDGDILMCFINSMSQIGKSCIFRDIGRPAIYTTNLFRIVPKKGYSSEYLQMIFTTSRFQNEIQLISKPAVNQASFTKSDLEQLYVPVPPTTERDLITQAVTSIGDKILATEHRLMGLLGIKKALMQDLLTGKVRVNVNQKESAVS